MKLQKTLVFGIVALSLLAGCNTQSTMSGSPVDMGIAGIPDSPTFFSRNDPHPTGRALGRAQGDAKPGGSKTGGTDNGIYYHGGPVMLGTTHVYYIWYGDWSGDAAANSILTDFASNIGGSPYYNINTTYSDGAGHKVSNSVAYSGASADTRYTYGKAISDNNVLAIVSDAITSGRLPKDTNGVYFVLGAADVTETSGMCSSYCAWHSHASISNADIKFGFIGNPLYCPSGCEIQTLGPNGSGAGDGMANLVAHELEEAVTDPDLNAWYDHRGYENADKAAWTFGTTYTAANGAKANMKLGSRDYMIQQNWVNANGGYAALQI